MSDEQILSDEREAFEESAEAESENRQRALEMVRFARLGEQWPDNIAKKRRFEDRPMLTLNRFPAFARQVINDSRQNRPQIKVKGVDNKSDGETADVFAGLIRNIEHVSKADIAYDTAIENAVYGGFGYLRIAIDYEYDDSFDKGLRIQSVPNPFTVYGDPHATCSDGSSWNRAFVTDQLSKKEFQAKYKGATTVDWDTAGYGGLSLPWVDGDDVTVCESWSREKVKRKILLLSDGSIIGAKEYEQAKALLDAMQITVTQQRETNSYKVTQRIMTGAEILETNEWAGQYIPLIPVYGEEFNVEGKRYFLSLFHHAKDAQTMFNYWRTTSTEMVALAPRVPYIGQEGAFDADPNWQTANSKSHPYLMYGAGKDMPQRQPIDSGVAAGAMQEAMSSADDMKAILGLYDAALGARSNETSGKAINARKMEGDVSTFHFIDNLSRAIRQCACCLVDLIPKTYSGERIIRVIGEDGKETPRTLGAAPEQAEMEEPEIPQDLPAYEQKRLKQEAAMKRVYDLGVGKYDVAVETGPSFTTRREEVAAQMTEAIRSHPEIAPIVLPKMVKAMEWPEAEEMAEQLEKMSPANGPQIPPEIEKQMADMDQQLQAANEELAKGKAQAEKLTTDIQMQKIDLAEKDLQIKTMQAIDQLNDFVQSHGHKPEDEKPAEKPQQQAAINIGGNIGEEIASAIAPAMAQALAQALQSMPPLQVQLPPAQKMKRTPYRDRNGVITHAIDEPMIDEPMQAGMTQ
jgi:hypothetical protein